MASRTELELYSADKKSRLHGIQWLPEGAAPKAVLQLVHGIAEHIGRYEEFALFLAANGYVVVGNSHLGHGRSAATPEAQGFFAEKDGWNFAVQDIHQLYQTTRARFPGLPYFMLGHSMGSFLVRTLLIQYKPALSGCVLTGTGQQPRLLLELGLMLANTEKHLCGPRKKSPMLQSLVFGAYNRRIPGFRTPYDWISRDPAIVDAYIADEDSGYVPTASLFADMMGGIRFIGNPRHIDRMQKNLPFLLLSGAADPVGDYGKGPQKVTALFSNAGLTQVALKLYPEARHEILNETNRQEVYKDILAFMDLHL